MKFVQRISVILVSLFLILPTAAAQKNNPPPSPKPKIDYVLPYPGILPDHPLYTIKLLRDRILDFLVVDPMRKAEFYILQADKHLGMGTQLLDKGKSDLAQTAFMQSDKYMSQALANVIALKKAGKEVPGYLVDRLAKAIAKHEEVLMGLVEKATGKELEALKASLATIQKLAGDISGLK